MSSAAREGTNGIDATNPEGRVAFKFDVTDKQSAQDLDSGTSNAMKRAFIDLDDDEDDDIEVLSESKASSKHGFPATKRRDAVSLFKKLPEDLADPVKPEKKQSPTRRFEIFDQPTTGVELPDNIEQMIQFIKFNRDGRYSMDIIRLANTMKDRVTKSKQSQLHLLRTKESDTRKLETLMKFPDGGDPTSNTFRKIKLLVDTQESNDHRIVAEENLQQQLYNQIRNVIRKPNRSLEMIIRNVSAAEHDRAMQLRHIENIARQHAISMTSAITETYAVPGYDAEMSDGSRGSELYGRTFTPSTDTEHEAIERLIGSGFDQDMPTDKRASTPAAMQSSLLEHQKIGLTWLLKQENANIGGILADDMGLGKTVQIIALICANKSTNPDCKTTLIVAPVALLQQWAAELSRHIKRDAQLKVYIHHRDTNPKMLQTWRDLSKFDVVITTYDFIARECASRGGLNESGPNTLDSSPLFQGKWYRIVLDEAQLIKNRNSNRAKAACLLAGEHRWCLSGTPMQNNVEEYYSFMKFLQVNPYDDLRYFTTRISNGFKIKRSVNGQDEKGIPQDAECMQRLRALLNKTLLRRTKKSTVDGHPILELPDKFIEKVESAFDTAQAEYYLSLETKAQIEVNKYLNRSKSQREPHDYSSVLTWLLRLRQACCHPILVEKSTMKNGSLLRDGSDTAAVKLCRSLPSDSRDRVLRLLDENEEFDCPICMEPIENDSVVLLAPCAHHLCESCAVDYLSQMANSTLQPRCVTCQGNVNYEKYIDLALFKLVSQGYTEDAIEKERKKEKALLRKKVVERRRLMQKMREERQQRELNDELFKDMNEFEGNILDQDVETDDEKEKDDEFDEDNVRIVKQLGMADLFPEPRGWVSSSKVDKCVEIIKKVMNETPDEKIIVFSQFTSLLDLLAVPLFKEGLDHLRYDGSMNSNLRSLTVREFMTEPEQRIMLISLKAGNVGLTLTAANHVVVMDPFWNPYVEDQAVDRAYRIGQRREVHVSKLVVSNTVEDRILNLQLQKREIIDAALDEGELKRTSRLGRDELRYIFGLGGMPQGPPGAAT